MGDEVFTENEYYQFDYLNVLSGNASIPTATVRIKSIDNTFEESSTGHGPVDAMFNAIDRALNIKPVVESYHVRSVTSGREALGEVNVRMKIAEQIYSGRGISTDIIEASGKAYLQALNQMELQKCETEKFIEENALTNAS